MPLTTDSEVGFPSHAMKGSNVDNEGMVFLVFALSCCALAAV
jgi:hypothetical protein